MNLSERQVGDAVIVDVDGPSDGEPALVQLVERLLARDVRRIVLHFRSHSLDSGALGQATACWLKATKRGAMLKLASRQPKVWELIRMLRLDRVLECYRSDDEAVASFGA